MTQTAKPADYWHRQADVAMIDGADLAAQAYHYAAIHPDRINRLDDTELDMHRPSNCEYAGMGDHTAENCPAGGV